MVIFTDASEVLFGCIYTMQNIIINRYGQEVNARFWERHLKTNDDIVAAFRGAFCEKGCWEDLLEDSGLPMSKEDLEDILTESIKTPVPGTLSVYQRIISHPVLIGSKMMTIGRPIIYVTSDHMHERVSQIEYLHPEVFDIVKRSFWSCELGHIKQDPEFFPSVLEATGLSPGEVVFIDDIEANVASAKEQGIYGITFKNATQLEEELVSIGFQFAV